MTAIINETEAAHIEMLARCYGAKVMAEGVTDPIAFFLRCAELHEEHLKEMLRCVIDDGANAERTERGRRIVEAVAIGVWQSVNAA